MVAIIMATIAMKIERIDTNRTEDMNARPLARGLALVDEVAVAGFAEQRHGQAA
jgi:hypothetical protein